jgi:hypothetical protein
MRWRDDLIISQRLTLGSTISIYRGSRLLFWNSWHDLPSSFILATLNPCFISWFRHSLKSFQSILSMNCYPPLSWPPSSNAILCLMFWVRENPRQSITTLGGHAKSSFIILLINNDRRERERERESIESKNKNKKSLELFFEWQAIVQTKDCFASRFPSRSWTFHRKHKGRQLRLQRMSQVGKWTWLETHHVPEDKWCSRPKEIDNRLRWSDLLPNNCRRQVYSTFTSWSRCERGRGKSSNAYKSWKDMKEMSSTRHDSFMIERLLTSDLRSVTHVSPSMSRDLRSALKSNLRIGN